MDENEWKKKITDIEEWRREKEEGNNNIIKEIERYRLKQENEMKKFKTGFTLTMAVLFALLVIEIILSF